MTNELVFLTAIQFISGSVVCQFLGEFQSDNNNEKFREKKINTNATIVKQSYVLN